jgi:diadenosine tetraphosphate (Ap4A) HIT family hydrolase
VAFLSIGPLTDGHTLVVPREEIDKWTDASPELVAHLTTVAQLIGKAQIVAFGSERAGLEIAGFEVDHLHVHVWPTNSLEDFDLTRARTDVPDEEFDAALAALRAELVKQGHGEFVPQG